MEIKAPEIAVKCPSCNRIFTDPETAKFIQLYSKCESCDKIYYETLTLG